MPCTLPMDTGNENCDYVIRPANTPTVDVGYSHTHPCRCTCGKRHCSFSHQAQLWVSFCWGAGQGEQPELPSRTLALGGFGSWAFAILRLRSSVPRRHGAGWQPWCGILAVPPPGTWADSFSWGTDRVSVLIGDLESSELWIAVVTGVDTGWFMLCYLF